MSLALYGMDGMESSSSDSMSNGRRRHEETDSIDKVWIIPRPAGVQ